MREITRAAGEAWQKQWRPNNERTPPEGGWDWPDIWTDRKRHHTELFHAAVWFGDRLCGLALGVPNRTAVVLEGVEGDPNSDNPAKGLVLLTVLEAATCYAQITGRQEIWLKEPANERLVSHYVDAYGFELVTDKAHKPYCRKRV
ncbi:MULTISPECIES: hypothetical protein [unclassified Methylobacterium]|uniref:hypothetical protein n=1 Tax=unclassified Methylobacterium TaxID=2615210 RepID=UPI00226A4CA7|nr:MULTISPECIES: hypothetical protein [unclassified Methylobacterium]